MELIEYLIPTEQIAQGVVIAQLALFGFWLVILIRSWIRIKSFANMIEECADVDELSRHVRTTALEDAEASTNRFILPDRTESSVEVLHGFCSRVGMEESHPLYRHLRTMFRAGIHKSSLESDALVRSTFDRVTVGNTFLKSLLSVFIILGLLGTLFGLAGSLSSLSGVFQTNNSLDNEALRGILNTILAKLGGAFAPSIWGVALTIFGVLLFSAFLRGVVQPVRQALEVATFSEWLPALTVSPSSVMHSQLSKLRKDLESLPLLGERMKDNFTQIADSAATISAGAESMADSMDKARRVFGDLITSSTQLTDFSRLFTRDLDNFSNRFQSSVDSLAPVTEGLADLYHQMANDSEKFQSSVANTIAESDEFRRRVEGEFERQTSQTQQILNALVAYEDAYLAGRESVDSQLQETMTAASSALNNLSQQNEVLISALIKSVGDPLRQDLTSELNKISIAFDSVSASIRSELSTMSNESKSSLQSLSRENAEAITILTNNLQDIATKFGRLQDPIRTSADSIEATAATFNLQMGRWLEDIKSEFTNLYSDLTATLEGLNTGLETQNDHATLKLERLDELNRRLGQFIERVNTPVNRQSVSFDEPRTGTNTTGNSQKEIRVVEPRSGVKGWLKQIFRRRP